MEQVGTEGSIQADTVCLLNSVDIPDTCQLIHIVEMTRARSHYNTKYSHREIWQGSVPSIPQSQADSDHIPEL